MSCYRLQRGRYARRNLLTICSISFIIILLISSVHIYRRQLHDDDDDGQDRPDYCDQSMLQKFYMHDRRYLFPHYSFL